MLKWFHKIKQKRKMKRKMNEIKKYLTFINIMTSLIEKIENFKIKFIKIAIHIQDIDSFFYNISQCNLENSTEEKLCSEAKKEAIKFLKEYQASYQEQINKIRQKYEYLIPWFNEAIQINQAEKLLLEKGIASTITLKNINNKLIKINLNDSIENIDSNLLITESESDSNNDLELSTQKTKTLASYYIYNRHIP